MSEVLKDDRALQIPVWKQILNALGIYAIVILLIPVALIADNNFLTTGNLGTMLTGMLAFHMSRRMRATELQAAAEAHARDVADAQSRNEDPPPQPSPPTPRWRTRILPPVLVAGAALLAAEATGLIPVREGLALLRTGLEFHLIEFNEITLTPVTLLTVGLVLVASSWASRAIQAGMGRSLRIQDDVDEGVIAALQRLVHYAVLTVGLIIGLQTAGIDLSAIIAASAVFAVGIGFGLQTIARNFVSGILLLIERTIKPGDILTVDGTVVRIREMGIRATIAQSLDDEDLIIPNSLLMENTVINHSLHSNVVRARAVVGVTYGADLDQVNKLLLQAARKVSSRVRKKEPTVLLLGFGGSSIDFEVSIWVRSAFQRPADLSALRLSIWRVFRDHDIEIPFTQIDLHLDPPVMDALRGPQDPPSTPT